MKIKLLHQNDISAHFKNYEITTGFDAEVIVAGSKTELDPITLGDYPNLKYIIQCSNGVNTIDVEYTKNRDIKIFNSPLANANAVAEYVCASALALLRKLPQAHESMRGGKWERDAFFGRELHECTIGLIGFGNIAKLVHKKLSSFGTEFLVVDPFLSKEQIEIDQKTKKVELQELLKNADIVSIHIPLVEATRNLISKGELAQMKKDTILINSSRGGIINETDLIEELKTKRLFAALDVFENEPEIKKKFFELENVLLTPHLASMTKKSQEEMILEAKRNFETFLAEKD